jgi:hypothetical protein
MRTVCGHVLLEFALDGLLLAGTSLFYVHLDRSLKSPVEYQAELFVDYYKPADT